MHPVKKKRLDAGLTIAELAKRTGLSESTIRGIEGGNKVYKTGLSVAEQFATIFDCNVLDLFDANELSHLGRPALTGGQNTITVTTTTTTTTTQVTINGTICPRCWLQAAATGNCGC